MHVYVDVPQMPHLVPTTGVVSLHVTVLPPPLHTLTPHEPHALPGSPGNTVHPPHSLPSLVLRHEVERLSAAHAYFDVMHVPGHAPGLVAFTGHGVSFGGDLLFAGSIGRTDFPMGNHQDLIDAITTRLWPLGDDTAFVPGHGPMSTFGQERRNNPFVADRVLARA